MNPNDCDHPDLTAHILGELDAEHAEAMAQWIASHPEAKAEAAHLSEIAQMLKETAPVSFHTLRPEQRAAVLSGPQRVRQMVASVQQPKQRRATRSYPMLWSTARVAAAAAIAVTAYVAGVHFGSSRNPALVPVVTSAPAPVEVKEKPKTTPFRAKELTAPVIADATPVVVAVPAPVNTAPSAKAPEPKKETVVAVALALAPPTPTPEPPTVVVTPPSTTIVAQGFVNTSKATLAQVALRPAATRPPVKTAKASTGPALGSPTTVTAKPPAPAKPAKAPELLIHSWKTDVVSCPWDESHRLVRLVIQMPGEQAAAINGGNYPLQMNFSASTVRNFRQLGERTVPAKEAAGPAFHIVWFEVAPNGQLAGGGTRTLGEITLPNARFTDPAVSAFDSSKLKVLDRGATWQNARPDVLFESSIVGFGLLMKGDKEAGSLNHAMVLDLAQRSKQDESNSEYSKFIKVVRDAGRVAGLK